MNDDSITISLPSNARSIKVTYNDYGNNDTLTFPDDAYDVRITFRRRTGVPVQDAGATGKEE